MNAIRPDHSPADPAGAPERRLCILMNRSSGGQGETGEAEAVRRFVDASHGRVVLREFGRDAPLEDICREAVDEGFGTVVAAGGDGTIAGVASCLVGTGRKMGVLPLGTFNFFARSLGIPEEIEAALSVLDEGEAKAVTVGDVNDRLFLNNASIGLYPHILRRREAIYRRWGRSRLAAYWSVVRTVLGFRGSRRFRVTVDGAERRVKTPLVFVSISAFQLEAYGLEGAEKAREGDLVVFVAPDCGRFGLLRFAALLLLRGMRRGQDFELFHGREIEITPVVRPDLKRLIARDGEKERLAPPFRFRARPDALGVIVPQDEGQTAR